MFGGFPARALVLFGIYVVCLRLAAFTCADPTDSNGRFPADIFAAKDSSREILTIEMKGSGSSRVLYRCLRVEGTFSVARSNIGRSLL
jgi:hypothetical protein